ncbi:MAG: HaeII family restriction endonuclease [Candidatus Coproplasma sp.]
MTSNQSCTFDYIQTSAGNKRGEFKFIDLFAGIGGIRLAFENVGGVCVFSSEWDENACKTYRANFGEQPSGDITKINAADIPDFDILLAGFPCQPFSIAGKKAGFNHETQGTLFFDVERILKAKKPKAFLLENVKNLKTHDNGNTLNTIISHLEALGYNVYYKVLNALDYGVPQKRERIIICGFLDNVEFEFPEPIDEKDRKTLSDILEKNVDKKYYVKESIRNSRLERLKDKNYPKPYISHENIAGSITPHPYCCALRAGASANYILINDERRPTERELLRIQGFPDSYKIVVSYGQVKHQTGNSVAVPMIEAVAKQMLIAMKKAKVKFMDKKLTEAKQALDLVIKKSRVHLYKPIQIAEILYRDRVFKDIDTSNLETYRTKSKAWRDTISLALLGRICTSSAKFQDDIFNAITPEQITVLARENKQNAGVVEAYIYQNFANKHNQLSTALNNCLTATRFTFNVKDFIDTFWAEAGLKRSIDKIYEIVVYSLFSTLINSLELRVEISINEDKLDMVKEFEDFTHSVMCIDFANPTSVQDAKVYRVGVTNAADRGLDMYTNWGPAVQIKHLTLDTELAENIVTSVNSDKIIIVCKSAEKDVILSLLTQIGWKNKIQSIITENDLCIWYEKALRGKYGDIMGDKLLNTLIEEIAEEFPSVDNGADCLKDRHYELIHSKDWEL